MLVAQTHETSYGRVQLAHAYIDGEIKTKLLSIVLKDAKYENTCQPMLLVRVKEQQLGLPFFIHAHWTEFQAATQEALSKTDWKVVEVLLWDNAVMEYEQEVEVIERDVQRAAAIKRYQQHVQGDLDRLIGQKDIKGTLHLIEEFFRTILTKRRN
jgi:hypothetical protein